MENSSNGQAPGLLTSSVLLFCSPVLPTPRAVDFITCPICSPALPVPPSLPSKPFHLSALWHQFPWAARALFCPRPGSGALPCPVSPVQPYLGLETGALLGRPLTRPRVSEEFPS